jgi:hypothetical protein
VTWSRNSARNEHVEEPGWQGAPSEEYWVYVSEAQRSQPGCFGVLIEQYLLTAVLARRQSIRVADIEHHLPLAELRASPDRHVSRTQTELW